MDPSFIGLDVCFYKWLLIVAPFAVYPLAVIGSSSHVSSDNYLSLPYSQQCLMMEVILLQVAKYYPKESPLAVELSRKEMVTLDGLTSNGLLS